jgi:hypothetical protein
MRNPQTPLTPREEDAFERLQMDTDGTNGHYQRSDAVEAVATGRFEKDEAQVLIDQLLSKGYLYAVDDEIRITE